MRFSSGVNYYLFSVCVACAFFIIINNQYHINSNETLFLTRINILFFSNSRLFIPVTDYPYRFLPVEPPVDTDYNYALGATEGLSDLFDFNDYEQF